MAATPLDDWKPTLAYHLVAHIDLLGQSEALDRLEAVTLPCTEAELREALKHTAIPVAELRNFFVSFFEAAGHSTGLLDQLPPEHRDAAERLRLQKVVVRSWSDMTVVTVSLMNTENPLIPRMVDVYRTLVAVAGIALSFLASGPKLVMRGGIDVGRAVNLPPVPGAPDSKEVYGKVIERAYKLEARLRSILESSSGTPS